MKINHSEQWTLAIRSFKLPSGRYTPVWLMIHDKFPT